MARKSTGIAVAIGAAIAIGAVVAFASGKKRKDEDEADEAEDETAEPSPVLPTGGVPPFVPPIQVSFPSTPSTPPVAPPVVPQVPTTPTEVPPIVELPDEDEDEDTEAEAPTVQLPGGVKVEVPAPGTTVTLPGGIPVTVPSIPGITAPPETPAAVPSPPAVAVEQPSAVPPDTATLVAQMLADEAHPTAWKKKYPALGAWQAARGLKADQSFGPGSAQRMAQEIGTLPIIRFWPKGTLPQTALEPYRQAIRAIAASAPEPRRAQLLMSANREQGQAFGTPPKPITQQVSLKQVAA